jgi:N-acyl-D-aspartate/D-glutamate deacylase
MDQHPAAIGYDLVIRRGTLIDGSGAPRRVGDIGIVAGKIARIGEIPEAGAQEIDASGLIVTPGFVDVHTHYDGQATWAERMQPSSWHGVTTVIMGNCGVGFAPCRPADRANLIRLMEGVEDIPNPVMTEGLPWNWESFPEFLDALERRKFDLDIGVQLAHAPLRVFVMGSRGVNREPATPAEIAEMARLAEQAMRAGGLGFSTSRTLAHKSADGENIPTYDAAEAELMGIAMGLKAAGAGVLQMVSDLDDPEADFAMMRRLAEQSGRPLSFTLLERPLSPGSWKFMLQALEATGQAGLPILAQVACRPVGLLLGLEATLSPFLMNPVFNEIAKLGLAEKLSRLRDPEFRRRLLEAGATTPAIFGWERVFPLSEATPDYEPLPEQSIAARAAAAGVSPDAYALDHMLNTRDGRGLVLVPVLNYAEGNLDVVREMMESPYAIAGLSDGGAHMGSICDGSFPTTLLTHWARDRSRGGRFTLEHVVAMQTGRTAAAIGLHDRGLLRAGLRADINIIDFDKLNVMAPEFAYDLPAGGRHLVQRAEGYRYTMVAGEITYRDGIATGALPGRLVRGARYPAGAAPAGAAPAAAVAST